VLLSPDLGVFLIRHSFNTFCVLILSSQHSPSWHFSLPWWLLPIFIQIFIAFPTPIQIRRYLTSHYTFVIYEKSSQMALELYFVHLPGTNNRPIQGEPLVSLRCWWIVCSCFGQTWWDGRCSGWHWRCDWLISFDCLIGLFFWCMFFYLWITGLFLWFLNVARQKYNIWEDDSQSNSEVIIGNNPCIMLAVDGIDCLCTSRKSQITRAVLCRHIHMNSGISQSLRGISG
jgi:hypothetical protein